jgi:hypothetical protein
MKSLGEEKDMEVRVLKEFFTCLLPLDIKGFMDPLCYRPLVILKFKFCDFNFFRYDPAGVKI